MSKNSSKRNLLFAADANQLKLTDLQWYALEALQSDLSVPAELRKIAAQKIGYFAKPSGGVAWRDSWMALTAPARTQNAAEFSLDSFLDENFDPQFRSLLLKFLGTSPTSDGETISRLTAIAAGAKFTKVSELKEANETIKVIAARIGSHPARTASSVPRTDLKDILLHEPIASVKPFGGGRNASFLVEFTNGEKGVFKPRLGDVKYNSGNPNEVDFAREVTAVELIDDFLKNSAANNEGKSQIFTEKTVAVALVHDGNSYGLGSLQAFAKGFFDIEKISTDPRYAKIWQTLQNQPKWKELENRLRAVDYIMGNYDRLPLPINGRTYPKNLMIGIEGVDFSDPAKLEEDLSGIDWRKLKANLIDNGFGRGSEGEFNISDLGHFPLRADIPEDLKEAILQFDEVEFRRQMSDRLSPFGIEDVINRVHEAQDRIRNGP